MGASEGAYTVHPFEAAGLGKAPFRVLGVGRETYQACPGAPIQPGAACQFCGQGIQTAAYSLEGMLMAEPDGTLMLLPIVQKRLIVQLCGDGKPRVHECNDPVDYEDWRAVLRLHRRTARYAK